jgi:hypothetical protein
MYIMFALHRKHIYGPPRHITGIELHFIYSDDVHTSPPRLFTEGVLLFIYVDAVRTSQETELLASTACYRDGFNSLYDMIVPHRKHIYGPPRSVTETD